MPGRQESETTMSDGSARLDPTAAARLATEVATQQDGQGSPRSLPSPVAPAVSVARRAVTPAADPYR